MKHQVVESKSKSIGDLFLGPGKPANETSKERLKLAQPVPPKTLQKVQKVTQNTISLEINVERQAKHQAKPINMYSFVCGKSFRRNEYPNHMKNVHNDIMGGIDNWMEHRCPLASYGCEFSSRLWYPRSSFEDEMSCTKSIIFCPGIESFGTTMIQHNKLEAVEDEDMNVFNPVTYAPSSNTSLLNLSKKGMLDLPDEILYKIVDYLDPFW